MYRTPIYKKWEGMKKRCLNKNERSYKDYGGRGIKICEKWMEFTGFYEDMAESFVEGLSIERIDNNGDYCKENCKWIPVEKQARNKRTVKKFPFRGKLMTIPEIAILVGLKTDTLRARIKKYGWSIEKAVSLPKTTYKGYFKDSRGLWKVEARINGKKHFIGRYETENQAKKARREYMKTLRQPTKRSIRVLT